jgi:hypothetical protein
MTSDQVRPSWGRSACHGCELYVEGFHNEYEYGWHPTDVTVPAPGHRVIEHVTLSSLMQALAHADPDDALSTLELVHSPHAMALLVAALENVMLADDPFLAGIDDEHFRSACLNVARSQANAVLWYGDEELAIVSSRLRTAAWALVQDIAKSEAEVSPVPSARCGDIDIEFAEQPDRRRAAQLDVLRHYDPCRRCCICGRRLLIPASGAQTGNWQIVLEHCHVTGLIRGLAHNRCNGFEGRRNRPGTEWFDEYQRLFVCFPAISLAWTYHRTSELPRTTVGFRRLVEQVLADEFSTQATHYPELYMTGRFFENLLLHGVVLRKRSPDSEWIEFDEAMRRVCSLRRTHHQLGVPSESDRGGPPDHSCAWCLT